MPKAKKLEKLLQLKFQKLKVVMTMELLLKF